MKKYIPFINLFLILSSLVLFFVFRQTPKGELWKGYSVLYVPADASDEIVINALNQFDIKDFTCLSNQYLPTSLHPNSAEITLLNYNSNALDYLSKRKNYFFDKSHEHKLYYVPVENKTKLLSCVNYLNRNNIISGVDTTTSYPVLLPICVLVLLIMLFVFSKNKFLFLSSAALSVLYTVCYPYLTSTVSAILLILILFVSSMIYKRRGALKLLLGKIIFILMIFVSIVSSFSASVLSGVMFILLLAGSVSAYMLYDFLSSKLQKKTTFNPVYIRSARFIPQFAGKEKIIFPAFLAAICISFAVSILSIDSFSENTASISLPSSCATVHSDNLPDLDDYAKWDFIVKSFPYRSINKETEKNSSLFDDVSFYRYSSSGRNVIETKETLSFNSDFVDESVSQIDSLNFNAVEKILKTQGSNFVSGYSVSGSHRLSLFSIILVLVQFFCLSLYYIKTVFKIRRGKK